VTGHNVTGQNVTGQNVNLVPARYRSVSVASVPVPLDEASLREYFIGRPAYRRTRYIVARAAGADGAGVGAARVSAAGVGAARADAAEVGAVGVSMAGATAVVEVSRDSDTPLFAEITAVSLIAGPDETAFVDAPEADTGIPTSLSRVAADRAPGARCVVVRGRYGHVGFIVDPVPVRIRVVEVVPPHPAKLVDQASRVLDLAEELPPVELVPELTDLGSLAAGSPAGHYLFPCRAGTAVADGPVSYLDEIPPRADWTLIGCARSRAIHDWFYEREAPVVDMCPRNLALEGLRSGRLGPGPVLTKCCLLEDRIAVEDGLVVVPWGASLAEIRDGLGRAAATVPPAIVAQAALAAPARAPSPTAAPASTAQAAPAAPARAPSPTAAPASTAQAAPAAPARAPSPTAGPAGAVVPAGVAASSPTLTPAAAVGPTARPDRR
jgi:hypothetical protein